jgi:hypothetical protein
MMSQILTQIIAMDEPFNMVVLIIMVVMAGKAVMTIATEIGKYAAHRESMEAVREMVERGMSADEIERVLTAKPESGDASQVRLRVSR